MSDDPNYLALYHALQRANTGTFTYQKARSGPLITHTVCDKLFDATGLWDTYGREIRGMTQCTLPTKHQGPCGIVQYAKD